MLSDIDLDRLRVAKALGAANLTFHSSIASSNDIEKLAKDILGILHSENGPHCTIECSGADSSLSAGVLVSALRC